MDTQKQHDRAFTLLELVVVLGIVALASALLIKTVINVRDSAGDVTCQGNLRQLLVALQSYNVDHNGSMPYGMWSSELNRYFNVPKGYAPAFKCPQAVQQAPPHLVSYVMNMIVAVSPNDEVRVAPFPNPGAQTKPPSLHLMLREGTALIWDTSVNGEAPDGEGYHVGADVDNQRFWTGAQTPQRRYFSPSDPYGAIAPGTFGQNRPVQMGILFKNIDPPAPLNYPYQGNLRFRHDDQAKCNVAFSDGSVRQFTAVLRPDPTVQTHDALRRYFMIHWPPGVPPNPSEPH